MTDDVAGAPAVTPRAEDVDRPVGLDEVVEVLVGLGIPRADVERARDDDMLALLAIDALVLGEMHYDLEQVAERSGLTTEQLLTIWNALGLAAPRPGEVIFNDTDIEQLGAVAELAESGFADSEVILQLTRVLGSSMARVAATQTDILVGRLSPDRPNPMEAMGARWFDETFADVMAQVWRRHLRAAIRSRLSRPEGAEDQTLAVGFADLVGFTALSQQLDAASLAAVVGRFETVAFEIVGRHGGRVVKMIGDEVMFAIEDPVAAARCALDLAESYAEADDLSDVRVGVAYGSVIDRDGDLFGPAVNLASRLTGIAYPGSVVIGEAMADALDGIDDFRVRGMLPRRLKNIGRVRVHVLRTGDEPDDDRARSLRERRRNRLAELTGVLERRD